ncbi:tripartite tricarboxylate transporter substrate binding protein [Rhodoplanes roseus]|nr:tripartite tricarboxylate transporter substrate binding protein [Rhodoplanes roseus]
MRLTTAALALVSTLLTLLPGLGQARAETYPARPIRMVVPFPAGGGADVLVRLLTRHMGEELGAPFVIVNQPGAGGAIAFEQVAKAAPDGYTLTWISTAFPVMAATIPTLAFDPAKDFTPVAQATQSPFVLVVNPQLPARSVGELVALAKQKPGTLNFAHNGGGTLTKLAVGLFRQTADIDIGDVSYRGDNFSSADVVAGHVQGMFTSSPVALPHIGAGRLRGLAVTSAARSPAAPDLPTMAEAGVRDFTIVIWHGLAGPAGLPRDIVDRLNASLNTALAQPDIVSHTRDLGSERVGGTPEAFAALIRQELAFWSAAAKRAGVAGR